MPTIAYEQTWDVDLGAPDNSANATRVTSPVHAGAGALRLNPTAATAYWLKNAVGTPNVLVYQAWARFDTKPVADLLRVLYGFASGIGSAGLGFNFSANQFAIFNGGFNPGGPTVSAGVWYKLDARFDARANPWVIDAMVDDVALTQRTHGLAAATFADYRLGTSSESLTYDLIFDDLLVSHNAADYPISFATPSLYTPIPMRVRS